VTSFLNDPHILRVNICDNSKNNYRIIEKCRWEISVQLSEIRENPFLKKHFLFWHFLKFLSPHVVQLSAIFPSLSPSPSLSLTLSPSFSLTLSLSLSLSLLSLYLPPSLSLSIPPSFLFQYQMSNSQSQCTPTHFASNSTRTDSISNIGLVKYTGKELILCHYNQTRL
jgi:hypothetical protein